MPRQYEDASLLEKAAGKLKQHTARLFNTSMRALPHGERIVSICFDDFPGSAATLGADILERSGNRATYYTCFAEPEVIDYAERLHAKGHEIGCHTRDHINATFNPAALFEQSCRTNKQEAARHNIHLKHFCYPQGGITLAAKKHVKNNYLSARGGFSGINKGHMDIFNLRSVPFYENCIKKAHDFVNEISDKDGWLILFSHDVSDTPSPHGISIRALDALLENLHEKNIRVRPVGEVIGMLHAK